MIKITKSNSCTVMSFHMINPFKIGKPRIIILFKETH